ncbi:MAG: DUF424 family protein [Candidatus Micrarchaeaceae archaeon]
MDDLLIYVKLHASQGKLLVAMCDEELIGQMLEEGEITIDLDAYSDFYKGELTEPDDVKNKVDVAKVYSSNIVGKESIRAAINLGLIEAGNIKSVMGVPFAQSFLMDK